MGRGFDLGWCWIVGAGLLALSGCSDEPCPCEDEVGGPGGTAGTGASAGGGGGTAGTGASAGGAGTGAGGVAGTGGGDAGAAGTGGTPGEVHTGEGTYYGADGTGNCSFDASPDNLMVAAMNEADYAGSRICGACIEATGPNGTVVVRIVDRCPECAQGDVDFSYEAFGMIADHAAGRVPISWVEVPCDVTGPIVYRFKDGSSQWWTAIQVRNTRWAVDTLEVRVDGSYVALPRENYNYFVAAAGLGPGPYDTRVTDVRGHVLEDTGIPLGDATEASGAGQFPP